MTETTQIDLTQYIRDIPDFPQPGILFRDITPLLLAPEAFREAIRQMADHYREQQIDVIVAAEARGFIFAAPLAIELNAGFVPIRKPGKLPFRYPRVPLRAGIRYRHSGDARRWRRARPERSRRRRFTSDRRHSWGVLQIA